MIKLIKSLKHSIFKLLHHKIVIAILTMLIFRLFGGIVEGGASDPQVAGGGVCVWRGADQERDRVGGARRPLQNEGPHAAKRYPAGGRAHRHAAALCKSDPPPLHLPGYCCGLRAALGPPRQRLPRCKFNLILD